ncbi:hypothetical protein B7P43_G07967 [Cryptotermes secundus]|uniref:SEA domain-containing protein n=1 Tax=Cryptotermes secundus TaxID=105785 RepID=A0A2J7Q8V7_9NEOP|nr:hypothetical protein B7P43_G07967 [Cryptotermes secundus]
MDNLGFQQEVEGTAFPVCDSSNSECIPHWPGSLRLLPNSNGCDDNARETSSQPKICAPNTSSPKLSSSSFSLPKNKTLNKYRRFSESFSCTSRVPYCLGKMLNIPSRESVKHHNIKCSSFIISDNNNVSRTAPGSTATCQHHSCEDGVYIEIHCSSSNPVRSEKYQPDNKRLCSSQNFQGHTSVSSLLNNAQEISSYSSVPSLSLNNSYHEEYLCSMPPFSKTSISPYFSNKQNLISDTSLDIHNAVTQPPKSTNKCSNIGPSRPFLNNAQCSGNPSPYLMKKKQEFSKDDAELNSMPRIMKSQKNVNRVLNRSTTLPAVSIKNMRNQNREFTSGIPTVSGTLPMYYSRFLDRQQSSPNPCAENRQNMMQSSKVLPAGGREATLKKRAILRGWKLQFIPSDHSKRRTVVLCCILLLACILALVVTGLVFYMTTAMKSVTMKFQESCGPAETGVNVVAGEFRITNERFESSLKDETSADFKQLAAQITQQLNILFSASTLSAHYNHSHVTQFSDYLEKAGNGGILVQCKLVLLSAPPNGEAANQAGLEFLRGLRHHQGQMWLGNFAIDVQSIGFVAVMDTTALPEQKPDVALLPGWSSWSAWSECNTFTAASTRTQMRSRSCRLDTGEGAVLSSIEPCLLLEQAGGDLEVRDCENASTVTFLSSRVLEEGEIVSNDIGVDMAVEPAAGSSSSSMETIEGNTATMQTTERLESVADNTTLVNSSRRGPEIPVMGEQLSFAP